MLALYEPPQCLGDLVWVDQLWLTIVILTQARLCVWSLAFCLANEEFDELVDIFLCLNSEGFEFEDRVGILNSEYIIRLQ